MSSFRYLIKPTLFTFGVCGTCFCGSAIAQYEKHYGQEPRRWPFDARNQVYRYALTQTQKLKQILQSNGITVNKIAGTTIMANILVFGAWRIRPLLPIMQKYFLSQATPPKILLSPMILSCFSHQSLIHLSLNMTVLYSFSAVAYHLLGPEELTSLFISAGVVSSLSSLSFRILSGSKIASLGASGALFGIISYVCLTRPNDTLYVLLVPVVAGNAIKGLILLDIVGVIARWRMIDHAGHLGGALFGAWYALDGHNLYLNHRKSIMEKWVQLKRTLD